ncbi:Fic family protein [Acidipropionibacterium timonense]|uniref:Fic family protein n=1 Tax=Acidipropionibacterium timonense TaxID=2161818 RepID=UPI00102FAFF1|nr:Fic family protein [Acidipropionibacterium timonense]
MWNHPDRPRQDLPALPQEADVETPAVLKAAISASRALARLDGACERLPDPTMLINLIPLMEAQASSEIENIVTTNDELFKAANSALSEATPQVKEALRYREALRAGFDSLMTRPVTTQTAIDICSHIQASPALIRDQPGTYIGDPSTRTRIYTPPEGKDVILDHLSAWERFLHSDTELDPLVVMALAHYQFEAIHPFFDGNGRTGRILNMLILIEAGLLQLPVLYLSGHIVRHKDTYYERLNAVTRDDDWESWVLFMLRAVESTATWTFDIVESTDVMRSDMESRLRTLNASLPAPELSRMLFSQPYLRIGNVVDAGLARRQTASRWLTEIADAGLIIKEKMGRSVLFINSDLLRTLFHTPLPT